MFLGQHQHTIDEKGRIAIPAKFRPKLNGGGVVTRGLDFCLFLFAPTDWEKLAEKITALPLSQSNSRAFTRLMLAGANEVSLDSQGRILIPEFLRTYAGLTKKIIVTGLYNRIEIWDEEKWMQYKQKTEAQSDEIAEKLGEMGI